ncbi:ubiquinol-cytochrome c reductase [Halomonas cupida]|uniref:Predicted RNA-binding protein, contains PUA-like domain n=1 Tax=Halomonas cupida TaxID=44933 RepID=A0A1M7ADS3_9GAMM|nr:EVE domain-containing protein [Halomonas cupida]GEN22425.1 ubiquinol-cytochrome c reductase [Halomonas cupida]SHL40872.1 Predicted RNA-binding protein, contains PUA-like domain [Halomonas cupida]
MAYWLFKTEPDVFGWDDLVARGDQGEEWDGVRNYQARNNMRVMKKGDLGLLYHSNQGKEAVGIVEVIAEIHPDSTTDDTRWECVDIKAVQPLPRAVSLAQVKSEPRLTSMALVSNSRLSVQPVTDQEWKIVMELAGL